MTLFKSYTYAWWQIGIFKLALLAIGAAVGAYWHEFFGTETGLTVLIIVAITAGVYSIYASLKQ